MLCCWPTQVVNSESPRYCTDCPTPNLGVGFRYFGGRGVSGPMLKWLARSGRVDSVDSARTSVNMPNIGECPNMCQYSGLLVQIRPNYPQYSQKKSPKRGDGHHFCPLFRHFYGQRLDGFARVHRPAAREEQSEAGVSRHCPGYAAGRAEMKGSNARDSADSHGQCGQCWGSISPLGPALAAAFDRTLPHLL